MAKWGTSTQLDFPLQLKPNFELIKTYCNLWRYSHDIRSEYGSVRYTMNNYQNHSELQRVAGPGHWNDPDMVRELMEEWSPILWHSLALTGQLLYELRDEPIAAGHLGHHGSSVDNEQRSGNGATRDQGITAE